MPRVRVAVGESACDDVDLLAARVRLLEAFVGRSEIADCANIGLQWLGEVLGIRQSICLIRPEGEPSLFVVAAYGLGSAVTSFSVSLEDWRNPLVAAYINRKELFFPTPHSAADRKRRPVTPLEDAAFHAVPLGIAGSEEGAESAEAWHALGCAAADLGDEVEMRAAWKRSWALDTAPGAARDEQRRFTDAEVAAIAEQALEELPDRARELLRDVPIVIAEQPAESDVDAGVDPRSLGLFSGTAYPDGSHLGGQPGLTQILIFRRNLERLAAGDDELREEIRTTLLHETGHFFGLDDEELEGLGLG